MPVLLLCLLPAGGVPVNPPAVSQQDRFPPHEAVVEALAFNRACRCCMVAQQSVRRHRWWDYQAAVDYLDVSWIAWNALDDAQDPDGACHDEALLTLRTALGDDAFYAGRMPPPVPFWLFTEIDP